MDSGSKSSNPLIAPMLQTQFSFPIYMSCWALLHLRVVRSILPHQVDAESKGRIINYVNYIQHRFIRKNDADMMSKEKMTNYIA